MTRTRSKKHHKKHKKTSKKKEKTIGCRYDFCTINAGQKVLPSMW